MSDQTLSGLGTTGPVAPEPRSPLAPTEALPTVPGPAAAPAVEFDRDQVVCPECGTPADVTFNRRDAVDFCARCDYPLFWTPGVVIRDGAGGNGESLRRLPGTAGRVTVASATCPTCAEANLVAAEYCVRCGGPMVLPVVIEPEPVVVVEPEPLPPLEPEPTGVAWWWWVIGAATLVALIALIVVAIAR